MHSPLPTIIPGKTSSQSFLYFILAFWSICLKMILIVIFTNEKYANVQDTSTHYVLVSQNFFSMVLHILGSTVNSLQFVDGPQVRRQKPLLASKMCFSSSSHCSIAILSKSVIVPMQLLQMQICMPYSVSLTSCTLNRIEQP